MALPFTTEYPIPAEVGGAGRQGRFLPVPVPSHPGYYEGILIQSARQFASLAMCTALAIALGGGHFAVAVVASVPFIARMTHLAVPALILRYTSWGVARLALWTERLGFFAAAVVAIVRPGDATIPLFLLALAIAYLGQAIYDAAMSALHSEVARPGAFGEYMSEKTRWASIAGLAIGVSGAFAIDSIESVGIASHITRGAAIVFGIGLHCLIARPFAQMSAIARRRSTRPSRQISTVTRRSVLPSTREEWAVIHLALAWGFAYGFGARQSEAMAMRTLGISVGALTLLNAALVGAGVLGARTWGRLGDRFGGKSLMAIAMTAFALDPIWSLTAMYAHPAAFVPSYLIWGVFMTGWNIAQSLALVRPTGHAADRIRLITMYNVAYGLAAGVSPLLGGALLTWADARLEPREAFATLFVVTLILRLSTLPVLMRLPAAESAGVRYVSTVYMRLVKRQALRGTRVFGVALRAPLRLMGAR